MILQQVCARQKGSSIQNNTTQLTAMQHPIKIDAKHDQYTEEFKKKKRIGAHPFDRRTTSYS